MPRQGGVLGRVVEGPRTKQDVRAGKNIRVGDHDIEEFSDYFTDISKCTNESVPLESSRKENHCNSPMLARRRRTQITVPSLSPLSTSNKTSLSSGSNGMILRSMRRPSNVGIVSPNNSRVRLETSSVLQRRSSIQLKDNRVLGEDVTSPLRMDRKQPQMKDCEDPQRTSSGQVVKGSLVPDKLKESVESCSLEQAKASEGSSGGDGACEMALNDAGVPETAADVDKDEEGDVDRAFATTCGNDNDRVECLSNYDTDQVTLGQSSSATASVSSTSVDATEKNSLKKKKNKCDLFINNKTKSKSSKKSDSDESEGTPEGSLKLTPIHPSQKNPRFFTSTPAVKKSNRRIVSMTSISEIASPLPMPEVGTSIMQCTSCDPLLASQSAAPKRNQPRKSVTFNHTDARLSFEKIPEATSTVLPSFNAAEPLHYYETTFKNNSMKKKRIIIPELDEEGLRRSKRTRVEPLQWYKNERIKYKWTSDGWTIDGITTPQKTPKPIHRFVKRMAKKAEREEKKKSGELSVHVPVSENLLRQWSNVVEILDHSTNEPVARPCFFKYNQYDKMGCHTKQLATENDPVVMIRTMKFGDYTTGHLEIRPLQEKKVQFLTGVIIFVIQKGKVEVTIHESSFILETKDTFIVYPGNKYGIKNLRNEDAHLFYFTSKAPAK